jgi:hypothetical protein
MTDDIVITGAMAIEYRDRGPWVEGSKSNPRPLWQIVGLGRPWLDAEERQRYADAMLAAVAALDA